MRQEQQLPVRFPEMKNCRGGVTVAKASRDQMASACRNRGRAHLPLVTNATGTREATTPAAFAARETLPKLCSSDQHDAAASLDARAFTSSVGP